MITFLSLQNYRNFILEFFKTDVNIIFTSDENSFGKTSILETISLFDFGKSLRQINLLAFASSKSILLNKLFYHLDSNYIKLAIKYIEQLKSQIWIMSHEEINFFNIMLLHIKLY